MDGGVVGCGVAEGVELIVVGFWDWKKGDLKLILVSNRKYYIW